MLKSASSISAHKFAMERKKEKSSIISINSHKFAMERIQEKSSIISISSHKFAMERKKGKSSISSINSHKFSMERKKEVSPILIKEPTEPDWYIAAMRSTSLGIGTQVDDLPIIYDVYKTSCDTKKLASEGGRTIIADAFIENRRLGPLTELCVRAIAGVYLPHQLGPIVTDYPQRLRIYYENLSVDLPLEICYNIPYEGYWRRVVFAKSRDKIIAYKKLNWRSEGLTLKYVELVEACPAEYWPDDKMKALAMLINKYVTKMHLKRLQSLQEISFRSQIEAELAGDSSETSSYSLSSEEEGEEEEAAATEEAVTEAEKRGSECSLRRSSEDARVRIRLPGKAKGAAANKQTKDPDDGHVHITMPTSRASHSAPQSPRKTLTDFDESMARTEAQYKEYRKQRRAVKAAKRKRREAKQLAQQRASTRGSIWNPIQLLRLPQSKSSEMRLPEPEGVLDIVVEPPEYDDDELIIDRRNIRKLMDMHRRFGYPADQCHHIDLRFIRFFPLLTSFKIEFLGPIIERNYHTRHLNVSTRDMERLAVGLSFLRNLQIFRLCNSRLNAKKLLIITRSLSNLPHIESIDFRNNQLDDDCGPALYELFQNTNTIKSLELEGNRLGAETFQQLGEALSEYQGTLEYLGLGRNPLEDDSLHFLNQGILGTQHVRKLCLTGVSLTQDALWCCVANELMRQHPPLTHLDISAVPVVQRTAEELVKALQVNYGILAFDIRGCNVSTELIVEVEVLVKRNCYLAASPFIGNFQATEEEVNAYVNRLKHPVLTKALASAQKRSQCWFHHTNARRYSHVFDRLEDTGGRSQSRTQQSLEDTSRQSRSRTQQSLEDTSRESRSRTQQSVHLSKELEGPFDPKKRNTEGRATPKRSSSKNKASISKSLPLPFIYDTNSLNEKDFIKYVKLPGPSDRYYYLRSKKDGDAIIR